MKGGSLKSVKGCEEGDVFGALGHGGGGGRGSLVIHILRTPVTPSVSEVLPVCAGFTDAGPLAAGGAALRGGETPSRQKDVCSV